MGITRSDARLIALGATVLALLSGVTPAAAQYDPVDRTNPGRFQSWWGVTFDVPAPATQCGRHGPADRTTIFIMRADAICPAPGRWSGDIKPDDIVVRFRADWNRTDDPGPDDDEPRLPPIRREIALDKCRTSRPDIRLQFRELPRVAGLPAFECRSAELEGSRVIKQAIGLTLFRGNRQQWDATRPPYPEVDYELDIEIPIGREDDAARIYDAIRRSLRLVPRTNPIIPF